MERCTDWWYTYPSEKYEFVSWDGYSQYMESQKIHVPVTTNQCMDVSQLTHPLGKCSKLSSRYLLPGFGLCMPGLWTQTLYILTLHESKPW